MAVLARNHWRYPATLDPLIRNTAPLFPQCGLLLRVKRNPEAETKCQTNAEAHIIQKLFTKTEFFKKHFKQKKLHLKTEATSAVTGSKMMETR
ncbi:hypothetical protein HNY73_016216 [Argiope bruennichi]|uniref:Uncharacterized protein n=1 Tax=Argiope bruennichi TaxID=94029 RepID=A0A8T0EHS0_ARGBR|nr:hypothetical protein HNY73_016216 [Argiope bruennichi]